MFEYFPARPAKAVAGQWLLMGLLLLLAFGLATDAHAHKVNVFADLEGNRIYVQGYFLDGKKAKNSAVNVFSESGERLVEGHTNEEGEFTFVIPSKQGLRIVLNAGEGHQAEYTFTAAEIAGGAAEPAAQRADAASQPGAPVAGNDAAVQGIDATVRRAIAEGIRPLAREVAELKERRAASDIIGGIGFIIGILGLFAYFKARKQS